MRLIRRLDAGGQVTIVRAEAGAGKTVLVAQWVAESHDQRTVWVTLDESITDPRSFWFRVFTSLISALPGSFSDLATAYTDGSIPAAQGPAVLAAALQSDQAPVVLVIDDLHHVADATQDQLMSLLHQVPHLRLVATSRHRTRFEDVLTRAALDVGVIGSAELAFTTEELVQLADDLPFVLDEAELAMLERITQGHSLTTRLAVFLVRSLSADGRYRPTRQEIASGLEAAASDFVPRFDDDETEQLALAVALCPETDEFLATQLGGDRGWSRVEGLEESGLGRIALRRGRPVFVLHALVRAALRRRAEQDLSSAQIGRIRSIAFAHLRDLADPVDLLILLVEGEMDEEVFAHFVRHFSEFSLHRTRELIDILDRIPAERLERQGDLAIILATALSEGSVVTTPRARRLVHHGLVQLEEAAADSKGPQAALISLARLAGLRAVRDYADAKEAAEESLARIKELEADGDDFGWFAGKLQILLTALLVHRFDWAHELAGILDDDTHTGRQHHRDSLLAFAHAYDGDMVAAGRHLAAIAEAEPPGWRESFYAVGWRLAAALSAANDGDAEEAFDLLAPLFEQLHVLDLWPAVVWTRARIRLTSGQVTEGLAELEIVATQQRAFPVSTGWAEQLYTIHAELLMATGDLARATEILGDRINGDQVDPAVRLARARRHWLRSEFSEAMAELDRPVAVSYRPGQEAQRQLLCAATHARLGHDEAAATLTRQGFGALNRLHLRLVPSLLPGDSLETLTTLAGLDPAPVPLGRPFANAKALAEPLTKRERAVLRGLATGASIEDLAKTSFVSPNTIKTQARSVYRKLQVSNRAEAVQRARLLGLL